MEGVMAKVYLSAEDIYPKLFIVITHLYRNIGKFFE